MKFTLSLLFVLSLSMAAAQSDWAISIDAEPLLEYTGNIVGGAGEILPVWQGSQDLPLGLDVSRYRSEKQDWLRYRLQSSYRQSRDKTSVPLLDDDLQVIDGRQGIDLDLQSQLSIYASVSREHYRGSGPLKGIWGRGIGLGTSRVLRQYEISNPIEAYLGDTLWRDTGFSLRADIHLYTGVIYEIVPDVAISGRLLWGLSATYRPESSARIVN